MDPLTSINAFFVKWGFVILLIVALLLGFFGWLWWHDYQVGKSAAALPKAQAIQNKAESNAGHAAIETTQKNSDTNATIDRQREANVTIINRIPEAHTTIAPVVDTALRRIICLHKSAVDLPECQQLLGTNP